jgi:hypothetical protein
MYRSRGQDKRTHAGSTHAYISCTHFAQEVDFKESIQQSAEIVWKCWKNDRGKTPK